MTHLATDTGPLENPPGIISSPGTVGWVLSDRTMNALIDEGVKIRVKSERLHRDGTDTSKTKRLIMSLPGRGISPGRRLAEVRVTMIDSPELSEQMEALSLTVYGPNKKAFHRERLFDGSVASREELLGKLQELVPDQVRGRLT